MYIPCEASSWTLLHQNRKLSSRISLQKQLFYLYRLPAVNVLFYVLWCQEWFQCKHEVRFVSICIMHAWYTDPVETPSLNSGSYCSSFVFFFFISCDILFLHGCFVYCDFLIFSPLTVVPLFSDVHYPSDILFLSLYITTFMHGLLKKRNEISTGI